MKKLGCPLAVVVVLSIIVLLAFAWQQFVVHEAMAATSPSLFIATGPAVGNQAHFITLGRQDRVITLFVLPASDSHGKPAPVARIELDRKIEAAVWSRDGSMIACRWRNDANVIEYSYAYDFVERKTIMPSGVTANSIDRKSPIDWTGNNNAIEKLLESRGGTGHQLTRSNIEQGSHKLDSAEWQAYRQK